MGGILEHQAGPLRALLTQIRQTYLERIQDAVIAGLEALKEKCRVTVFSDSQYVVNAMAGGWARRWQAKGWKRNRREKAINPDLWQRLLAACERRKVHFQ
jgi:ribonuclease HI